MRSVAALFVSGLVLVGCGGKQEESAWKVYPVTGPEPSAAPAPAGNPSTPIVTPGAPQPGRIASVNVNGRFVVVSFPIGALPPEGQVMAVFRDGLKVGEIRMDRFREDFNVVADVLKGDCQNGDEVRPN